VDILRTVGARPGLFRVGFAAETEELRASAQKKLAEKHLDLVVANQVGVDGQGLGSDYNAATVIAPSGIVADIPRMSKWDVATRIWDAIDASRNHGG
jgi:phosphopantothenoylcysteine decarboxylase/phosphopantothenate--cysteine ligase